MNGRFIYYAAIAILFIALKLWYVTAGNEALQVFLAPVSNTISIITNTSASFSNETGYYYPALGIVIDKSCSGYNFWLLCCVMLSVITVPYIQRHRNALAAFPAIMLLCYLLTCFVNTARILFALLLTRIFPSLPASQQRIVHEAEGVFIYLSFLIIVYLLFQYCLKRLKYPNAKPAQS
jgi:exosortase K